MNASAISLFAIFFACLTACSVGHEKQQTRSEAGVRAGNPVITGWYADPEGVIFDDTYWIFPTYSARYEKQVFLDAFSSKDLVNWQKHERIIDTSRVRWAHKAMWAPSVVKKGRLYFLFFSANDIQTPDRQMWDPAVNTVGEVGGIGVGVASRPEGPYEDYLQKPLIGEVYNGAQPIDQFVYLDEDGQYYMLYGGWGHCNIVKLAPDFRSLLPFEDGTLAKEITPEGYVEGPILFKRGDWYYLMWSEGNWGNHTYRVAYGRSNSLMGPFQKIATVLEADTTVATGAGHHSVINIPDTDDWYMVYHRRPIPNQDRDHRVTCIDRMYFDQEGNILPVRMTIEGVARRLLREEQ
ncbi:glycoside hydrolase family 43 protein [Cesiribacter andamanensis]|nr:glycoside hydrolase family 43 protein [Cesiribacter andamanensis]